MNLFLVHQHQQLCAHIHNVKKLNFNPPNILTHITTHQFHPRTTMVRNEFKWFVFVVSTIIFITCTTLTGIFANQHITCTQLIKTKAIIQNSTCIIQSDNKENPSLYFDCVLIIEYSLQNSTHVNVSFSQIMPSAPPIGQSITIYYHTNNYIHPFTSDCSSNTLDQTIVFTILSTLALLSACGSCHIIRRDKRVRFSNQTTHISQHVEMV